MAHLSRNTLCVRATLQCMKTNDRVKVNNGVKICIKKPPARNLEYYFNIFVEELKKVVKSFRIFGVSGNIQISSLQNIKEQLRR